jgi:hypothetical protein
MPTREQIRAAKRLAHLDGQFETFKDPVRAKCCGRLTHIIVLRSGECLECHAERQKFLNGLADCTELM